MNWIPDHLMPVSSIYCPSANVPEAENMKVFFSISVHTLGQIRENVSICNLRLRLEHYLSEICLQIHEFKLINGFKLVTMSDTVLVHLFITRSNKKVGATSLFLT